MEQLVNVTNDTEHNRYLGGLCIPPGETRQVPAVWVQAEAPAEAEAEPDLPPNPLEELRSESVAAIVEAFIRLNADDLRALANLEEAAEKPRRTLLEAIAKELLERGSAEADLPPEAPQGEEQFIV